ncbi:MAG: L-seryl-tRNA(Sec) selenium transferase [Bryobacteraceae bacterium]
MSEKTPAPVTFRDLPAVDDVLSRLAERYPHTLIVAETRRVLERFRAEIRAGRSPAESVEEAVTRSLQGLRAPSLKPVINATGVILHTNLGRAPLGALAPIAGYSNLEYDLGTGRRGKRDVHLSTLFDRLLGAPAIAVNNNAAAVFLALHELAAGGEAIVSRGELIEIGDGFRIPDIMQRSGAALREVGTTNRTRIEDYRDAITDRTRLIMRVHPSNFHVSGFTAKPTLDELSGLARERGIPLYEDLGSGCLVDLTAYGVAEPLVGESLKAGVDLVSFSGDKLLGGPQAGLLAGRADLVTRLRRNPMFRALRLDKLILEAMGATLQAILFEEHDRVPALAMITQGLDQIRERAIRLAANIPGAEVLAGESVVGGGSTPDQALPTWLICVDGDAVAIERLLRRNDPPVVARIQNERLVIDLRTVFAEEEKDLLEALLLALRRT